MCRVNFPGSASHISVIRGYVLQLLRKVAPTRLCLPFLFHNFFLFPVFSFFYSQLASAACISHFRLASFPTPEGESFFPSCFPSCSPISYSSSSQNCYTHGFGCSEV